MSPTSFCRCGCLPRVVAERPCPHCRHIASCCSKFHSLFAVALQEYFRQFYPSVRSAKVITDAATGRSKGYGFVRFRCMLGPVVPQPFRFCCWVG